jgi:hypothetical protein
VTNSVPESQSMSKEAEPQQPALPPAHQALDEPGGLVGCLSFSVCFALCLVATAIISWYSLRDVPRPEVSDALYHTGLLAQWCCGGSFLSIAVSAVVAYLVSRRIRGRPQR